jgi:hypothetical protein
MAVTCMCHVDACMLANRHNVLSSNHKEADFLMLTSRVHKPYGTKNRLARILDRS